MNHPDDWSDEEMDSQLLDDIVIAIIASAVIAVLVLSFSAYFS